MVIFLGSMYSSTKAMEANNKQENNGDERRVWRWKEDEEVVESDGGGGGRRWRWKWKEGRWKEVVEGMSRSKWPGWVGCNIINDERPDRGAIEPFSPNIYNTYIIKI